MTEFNKDKRFDIALQEGEIKEKELADILTNKKIEVKFDKKFKETGNIAIEFRSRGKDSGIITSEADYWAFMLKGTGIIVIIYKNELQERLKRIPNTIVKGGDDNTSEMVLVRLDDLLYG